MNPRNIIIIRPDHLGDLILSLPVARALREKYPKCHISYLAATGPSSIAPMVSYVDSWIIDKGRNGILSVFELVRYLRQGDFDHLIELKPSWRTAIAGYFSGIPVRIGTARRFYSLFYNKRLNLPRRFSGLHQTDLDLAFLKPLGLDCSGLLPSLNVPERYEKEAGKLVGESIKEYIVIHPGSSGSAPNWPIKNYRDLAKLILREYAVIITGLEQDIGEFEGCLNLIGQTNLGQLAGIISRAKAFISGSTGPLHLADALGVKCISLFIDRPEIGPSRWGPRRNLENVITPGRFRCRCRNLSQCRCLEQVTPGEAFNKVKMVLNLNAMVD